jgi:tetratricopeptide (TPR) repeat protein
VVLVGWTEIPNFEEKSTLEIHVRLIALGSKFTLVLNNRWAAEVSDDTIPSGKIAFLGTAYESNPPSPVPPFTSVALDHLVLESRTIEVEAHHLRWNTLIKVDPRSRLRLAETFFAMDQPLSTLVQLKKAWKIQGYHRSPEELLLAAKSSLLLSLREEAEDYLDRCIEEDPDSDLARQALNEKAKILYLQDKFGQLKDHLEEALRYFPQDPTLLTLLGHAYTYFKDPQAASQAYDRAMAVDSNNGLIAQNAGRAYEQLGKIPLAEDRYVKAARAFFTAENFDELNLVLQRLLDLVPENPEVHAITGKRAYALEDWATAAKELAEAQRLYALLEDTGGRKIERDPAVPYLQGLLRLREGKRRAALPFFEQAVSIAPDYGPFWFRLAECRFLLTKKKDDPALNKELEAALRLSPEDGWVYNLAAQVAMAHGNLNQARAYLDKAEAVLGRAPALLANKAELSFLLGDQDGALGLLGTEGIVDERGIMDTEAGNILVRLERFEEAEQRYQRALKADPENLEYLSNRARCLIELGQYGEADTLLAQAYKGASNSEILELIAYVAVKKGEYPRGEASLRLALEQNPASISVLTSLAWIYSTMGRWARAEEQIQLLERLVTPGTEAFRSTAELRKQFLEATTKPAVCAVCGRAWRIERNPQPAPPLRLVAQPPEDLPAGTCPSCGKTYCIACAKTTLDNQGRFVCPQCGERLKLFDGGLKKLVADWASSNGYIAES